MSNLTVLNYNISELSKQELSDLGKALSSVERLKILELIEMNKEISIVKLSELSNIAVSSVAFHVQMLEKSNLIHTITKPGKHGSLRLCIPVVKVINIDLFNREKNDNYNTFTYNIPIGSYSDVYAVPKPTCGLASETEILEQADNPSSFFSPRKMEAQIIWMSHGYLVYKMPNYFLDGNTPVEISYSMEICSEAPFFNCNFKSDITFWINDVEVCTYTSPGDFGNRKGLFTPSWWNKELTQYGLLVTIKVTKDGVFINDAVMNDKYKIDDLNLQKPPFISFKIGVKNDAINKGGFNIFGEKFGDYPQNIIMKVKCL